jgi:hypothetical protein
MRRGFDGVRTVSGETRKGQINEPQSGQDREHAQESTKRRNNGSSRAVLSADVRANSSTRVRDLYPARRTDGLDLDDWFQAEKELKTSGHNRSRVIGQGERLHAIRV